MSVKKSIVKPATSSGTTPALRVLKKGTCRMVAPTSTGELTYNVGHRDSDKSLHLRVTGNTGGGYFSHEWIAFDAIRECIEAQPPGQPFKSLVLRKLYESTGANNYGFLAAVLRAEGILKPVPKAPFSHLPGDLSVFTGAMQKALKDKIDLVDEVAIKEAELAKARQQRAEAMQRSLANKANAKTAAKPVQTAVSGKSKGKPMQTPSAKPATVAGTKPAAKAPRKTGAETAH